ncbi:MAG: YegS/Rv2252/BmrU family lipid kinase [Woeseia sp.]|nr:YegS/Rv2252/BmrU family lipid kinase [Woeseia sp.]NNE62160.1 YegS/Rv2252/BmrU family lipid kinase [Woeseia sp.]
MTTLLIKNPYSRNGDTDIQPIVDELARIGPVDVFEVGCKETVADRIAKLEPALERIVVAGGDGTLNTVSRPILDSGKPLGVIPLGTANDFARTLCLPDDPVDAARAISNGKKRTVDVGIVNGHPFLNAVGVGLGPALTKELNGEKKKRLGVVAYLDSLIQVIYRRRRYLAKLVIDGEVHRLPFVQITIGNGRHYGGGLTICDDAAVDDGHLHVLGVRPLTPWQLFLRGIRLKFGAVKDDEKLYYARGCKVELEVRRRCEVTADGELVTTTPLKCHIIKDALSVYVPADEPADNVLDPDQQAGDLSFLAPDRAAAVAG